MNRESLCRACGKPIFFIKTKAGKTTPVDVKPLFFRESETGPELYVMIDGSTRRGQLCPENQATGIGYVSHFATCNNPEAFRKGGKKARKAAADHG